MIGHNSAAVITPDADEGTLFHYISLHIGDWMGGTAGMTPEQEGAYLRFLLHLYQRGKPLPDDDRFMSRVMSLSLRVWKRLKDQLVSLGKIVVRSGSLTNSRFEKERQKRAEEMRKRSAAAQARWNKSRQVSPEFASSLPETSPKLGANVGKKLNKINDPGVQMDMLSNIQYPISIKENNQQAAESSPASGMLEEIEGLNGTSLLMRVKVAKWINPLQPDYRTAQHWLTTTVQAYGGEAVKEAFAAVETKMASDDVVAAPLKLMAKICEQKKRERETAAKRKAEVASLQNISEETRRAIQRDKERLERGEKDAWF